MIYLFLFCHTHNLQVDVVFLFVSLYFFSSAFVLHFTQ